MYGKKESKNRKRRGEDWENWGSQGFLSDLLEV